MADKDSYSHPHSSIRHLYPLARPGCDLTAAIDILKKSSPIILPRLFALIGFSLFLLICTGVFASVLALAAAASGVEWLKWGGLYIGAILSIGVYPLLRDMVFAKPRLAHMCLLSEAVVRGDLKALPVSPTSPSAIIDHFASSYEQAEAMRGGAKEVLHDFHSKVGTLQTVFPNISSEKLLAFLISRLTYFPDMILSYTFARQDSNPARAAKDGLVYYAKHSPVLLRSAFACYVSQGACTLGSLLVALGPAVFLSFIVPEFLRGWMTFFAVLLTLNVRDALVYPLFLAFMLQKFHFEIKGQRYCEQTEAGLAKLSETFQEFQIEAKHD